MTWTQQAIGDAIRMGWREFNARYKGEYSYDAYRWKRHAHGYAGVPVPAEPVVTIAPELADADTEAIWDAMLALQAAHRNERSRKVKSEIDVKVDTDRPFGVAFFSDMHIGSTGVDYQRMRADLDLASSCKHMKIYLGGDAVDNVIIPKLGHVARDSQVVGPALQWLLFRDVVNTLLNRDALLAVGAGNHDLWTQRMAGIDGVAATLADVPVVYTGEGGYINLTVGEQKYTVYRKHRPGFSSRYNPSHSARQAMRFATKLADAYVIEHQHTPSIELAQAFGEMRAFIRTGTYKLIDSYAAEFGFNDGAIGTPVIVFDPFRRAMTTFMSLSDAVQFLEAA